MKRLFRFPACLYAVQLHREFHAAADVIRNGKLPLLIAERLAGYDQQSKMHAMVHCNCRAVTAVNVHCSGEAKGANTFQKWVIQSNVTRQI